MPTADDPEPDRDRQVSHPDPKDFIRALLRIKPEDAERARDDSPATRKRKPPEGPRHDYGED